MGMHADKFNTASAVQEINSREFNEKIEDALFSATASSVSWATRRVITAAGGFERALATKVIRQKISRKEITIPVEHNMSGANQQKALDEKTAALKKTHKNLDSIKAHTANSVTIGVFVTGYEAVPQQPVVTRTTGLRNEGKSAG